MLGELGKILFTVCISTITQDLLRHSGRKETGNPAGPKVGNNMAGPYDIIGWDDSGSIGADLLVGADEDALMHALSVSGQADLLVGGSGNTDLIGAASNPRHPQHHRARAALRQVAMRHAQAVTQRPLDRSRRYPLGFVPTTLPAATTALIPAAPQNLFRAERLVIPSDIAFDIGVVDVKVGNQSQFVQSVEVPAALFSEVAIDTHVHFDTAEVGNQISVQARNKLAVGSVDFTAGMIGSIAK